MNNDTITITLNTAKELVTAPELNLGSVNYSEAHGIERVALALQTDYPQFHLSTILIRLPRSEIILGIQMSDALRQYCQNKIEAEAQAIVAAKKWGRYSLIRVLLWVLVINAVAYIILEWLFKGNSVQQIIVALLVIANWVALWDPLETLMSVRSEHVRNKKLYEHIQNMKVEIEGYTI